MLAPVQERLQQDIEGWIAHNGGDRSSLIPVLQEVQKKYSRISDYAMQVIADQLDIHPVEVYGVVSFYSFLKEGHKGRFEVRLCRTISCDMAGKDRIARQLENELGIGFGETTPDGRFSLEWANCLGMCDQGPALLVNEQVFTKVTPEKVHEIIAEFKKMMDVNVFQQAEAH